MGDFKLYGRVDLQSMLAFLDCDPVDTKSPDSGVSTNPELPAWSRNSRPLDQLLMRGVTNVKVSSSGSRSGSSVAVLDNAIPQSGRFGLDYYCCSILLQHRNPVRHR